MHAPTLSGVSPPATKKGAHPGTAPRDCQSNACEVPPALSAAICVEKEGGGVAPVGLHALQDRNPCQSWTVLMTGTGDGIAVLRRLSSAELHRGQPASRDRRGDLVGGRVRRTPRRAPQVAARRRAPRGLRDRHLPRRRREDDADRVSARRDGGCRVLGVGDAADLDPRPCIGRPRFAALCRCAGRERAAWAAAVASTPQAHPRSAVSRRGPRARPGSTLAPTSSRRASRRPRSRSPRSSPALYAAYAARSK